MKKFYPVLLPLLLFKFIIQLVGNRNYGFHRDELLHLSVSEHLDWGYFEFPPFIAFIGKLSYFIFDYSLWGVRLFPTLAGVGILYLCCKIAVELGGKSKSVLLAGIAILTFVPFYRNHTLFQPVAFDQFFWLLAFFFVVKYLNSENKKFLIYVGIVAGIGLLNKYTMLFWGLGITVGFLFFDKGKVFKSKWLYISGIVSLLIFLPNVIWQIQNGIPFFDHINELNQSHLSEQSSWDFVAGQIEIPPILIFTLIGLFALLINKSFKKYRTLGVAFLTIFFTMWIFKAKAYYFFAAYPIVFSAAAVQVERWFERRPWINYVLAASMLVPMLYFIPMMTPVLPIDKFIDVYDIPSENGRYQLTGDYADMFGWKEQVALVDSVYKELPDSVRTNTVIWAENYGEAGALKILGDQYNLPDPISRHGTFWYWGYGNPDAELWISLGNEKEAVEYIFENCTLIKTITHPYAIDEEVDIPLYTCRNPKVDIPQWWEDYRPYIFE